MVDENMPDYIYIDWRERACFNKIARLFYLLFKIIYISLWFYFVPFSVIYLSYAIPDYFGNKISEADEEPEWHKTLDQRNQWLHRSLAVDITHYF